MFRKSLAYRNIVILILSILPFFIGLGISVLNSGDTVYFSSAINISGSQRMRTMLISNYGQAYINALEQGDQETRLAMENLLAEEIENYRIYFYALRDGNALLGLEENHFPDLREDLTTLEESVLLYIQYGKNLIESDMKQEAVDYLVNNAMVMKNHFDKVTNSFQIQNDALLEQQKRIDFSMISFGGIVTIVGVVLSMKIREKEYHANYDYLTKLKNRHSLFEDIKGMQTSENTMFFIDLNRFKVINDTFGHDVGDEVLIEVAKRLKSIFGPSHLYRYGGDEFIALIHEDPKQSMDGMIDEHVKTIREMISEPIIDSMDRKHYTGLSMGVVSSAVTIDNWHDLIKLTDDLMYDSKIISGNTIIYRSNAELEERLAILHDVNNILSSGILKLKYLPVHSYESDTVKMYNVTSTLESQSEILSAAEFLPILKRNGTLSELDKNSLMVLNRDYLQGHDHMKDASFIMTFSDDTLKNNATNGIIESMSLLSIPYKNLIIKIKQAYLKDPTILAFTKKISKLGLVLAVDDVNLDVSLREINHMDHIKVVKIGNALTATLVESDKKQRILYNFLDVLSSIGKTVIVEGIEKSELTTVLKMGLDPPGHETILYSSKLEDV